jgi:hypothetical protein
MSRDKVVKPEVLRNRFPVIFAGVQDRVRDLAVEILSGVQVHLSSRLHGIGLEIIKAIMATELEEVIGIKGKHLRDRRFVHGGVCRQRVPDTFSVLVMDGLSMLR